MLHTYSEEGGMHFLRNRYDSLKTFEKLITTHHLAIGETCVQGSIKSAEKTTFFEVFWTFNKNHTFSIQSPLDRGNLDIDFSLFFLSLEKGKLGRPFRVINYVIKYRVIC